MEQNGAQTVTDNSVKADGLQNMVEKLNLKLDELWERYLNLLDEYQKARVELLKELSSVPILLNSRVKSH
jgi:hypothetical protein